MSEEMNLKKLSAKFDVQDIEWRIQTAGQGQKGPFALIIPYITNRAIMQRLDDVCGMGNWKNEYISSPCGKGYLCGISILINGNWVTRWDGAEVSGNGGIDPVKSTLSNSMKRTGVQWGIGRYLYRFEAVWADCELCDYQSNAPSGYKFQYVKGKKGKPDFGMAWKAKPLPAWALPSSPKIVKEFNEGMEMAETMVDLKRAFTYAYNHAESEQSPELLKEFTDIKNAQIVRIRAHEAEQAKVKLEQARKAVKDAILIIKQCGNESALTGQVGIANSLAETIEDPEVQHNAKLSIKDAAEKRLEALTNPPVEEQDNGN